MTEARILKVRKKWKMIFFCAVFLVSAVVLLTLPRLATPLGIAYVMYLILNPAVPLMMKLGLNKKMSIAVLLIALTVILIYPLINIIPIVAEEGNKLSTYLPKIHEHSKINYDKLVVWAKQNYSLSLPEHLVDDVFGYSKKFIGDMLLKVPQFVASFAEWLFLVPLFVFFFLKDSRKLKFIILNLTPNSVFERFYYLSHQFNRRLGDYIFAKFVEASIVGVVITSGLLLMNVRFAFLLGLLAGVTNIIPYVGPLIGAVPAAIFALAEYGGEWGSLGAILLLYLIANIIDLAIVFPILISKIVDLHPIVVVVSVILGSQYMGVIGMVISIPLAAAVKLVVLEVYEEIYTR
jgi:putative permease